MKKIKLNYVIVAALVAMLGLGSMALADGGRGYGRGGGGGPCWDEGPGGDDQNGKKRGPGSCWDNLSDEQITKLKEERQAFFEATKELRQSINQKELELRSELAKKAPDAEKAIALQKELSDYKAQMGPKRIEHLLKRKEINPDAGNGFGRKGRKAHGSRHKGYRGCDRW